MLGHFRDKSLQRTVGVQMKRKGSYSNLSGNSELPLCPQRVTSFVTIVSNDFYKLKYRKKRSEMSAHFIHVIVVTQALVIKAVTFLNVTQK